MGKGSSSAAPAAPDAYETASTEANFNRLDTYSPSGSGVRYGYTDASGNFVQGTAPKGMQSAQSTVESPWEAQIRETLQPASVALTQRVVDDNIINLPDAARVQDRGTVAKSIFDRSWSMMAPSVEKANSKILNNMQSRGIPLGSAAFNDVMGEQQKQTEDTISRLAMDADINAGQEQTRQYSLDASARQNSIAELVAAMGGTYNPPSAVPSGSAQGVNYSSAVADQYTAENSAYQANQQAKAQSAGAIGSLGASMLMKCTEAAKDVEGFADIALATEALDALTVKVWRYKDGDDLARHIGPMAEDWQAATGLGDGKTISVIDAFGVTLAALQHALRRIDVLERAINREALH